MKRAKNLQLETGEKADEHSPSPEAMDTVVNAYLLDDSTHGIWDCDFAKNKTYVSAGWRKLHGVKPDAEVRFKDATNIEFMHPEDQHEFRQCFDDFTNCVTQDYSIEYRHKKAGGGYIWIYARGKWVEWDENGKGTRAIGTNSDISALKSSEEAFRRVSYRLELALNASQIGVWEHSVEKGTTHWDDMMFSILGVPPTNEGIITSGTWEKSIHPDDLQAVLQTATDSVNARTEFVLDYRIIRPSGEVRYLRSHGGFYFDEEVGDKHVGINLDITSDYLRAEELRTANELAESRNEALEIARKEMEFMSLHDALTGLPNRRHLDNTVEAINAQAHWKKVALLHIDLDRFKQINDTQGHAAGDAILKSVSKILLEAVGTSGSVARVGGDEFVIFVSENNEQTQLRSLANTIIAKTSEPYIYDGIEIRSSVSIGIASQQGTKFSAKKLIIDADIALYRAKNEGRARCEFFNEDMQRQIHAHKKLADEILRGLERNEFFNVYQPQIDARTMKICGVEALVRWRHPVRGVIPPYQFMQTAEEINVVAQIDRLVLEQAILDLHVWQAGNLPLNHVSVNVSSRRLRDPNLIKSLKGLDFKPGEVSFELLESIFLDEKDELVFWNIDQLKDMGIGIDVDDFGTGHASIVALIQLRPDRLKIDRQLVKPIVESFQQAHLVRSIVEIGKSQGIQVVAEGVETMDHTRLLRDMGCDVLQGFVFARPMNAEEVVYFVADQVSRVAS